MKSTRFSVQSHLVPGAIYLISIILFLICFLYYSCGNKPADKDVSIVPEPAEITVYQGEFLLNNNTKVGFENVNPCAPATMYITNAFGQVFFYKSNLLYA
jgi:hypothetical protein